jgi:hypothetical protein
MRARRLAPSLLMLAGCGSPDPIAGDARLVDAEVLTPDAAAFDAAGPDAEVPDAEAPDAADPVPLAGFGAITGMCGVLAEAELTGAAPLLFGGDLDFAADRYDDPADRAALTAGGLEIILDGNAGGSSVYSEVFAFEVLARCELATLVASENEIQYVPPDSKKADLLVSIDGHRIGVSVTRAVTFPFDTGVYTMAAATELIERKLDDIQVAQANAIDEDRWDKSMLATLAINAQHAEVFAAAWAAQDEQTRADTIVIVFTTSGDDLFIYTDQ